MFEFMMVILWLSVMYLPFGTTLLWGKYPWEGRGD